MHKSFGSMEIAKGPHVLKRQTLVILLKYGLGLGLLGFMIALYWHKETPQGEEVGLAAALARPVHWPAFAAAFMLCSFSVGVTFVRWYVLVRAQDLPFSLNGAVRLGLVGFFFNTFMPGSVGGDIIKAVAIAREQSRRTVAVATVLLDRVIGLCGLIWLVSIVGAALEWAGVHESAGLTAATRTMLRGVLVAIACLALATLVGWIMMGLFSEAWSHRVAERLERLPKVGTAVAELWRAVWMYRRRGRSVAVALGLSLFSHGSFVFAFYFGAQVLTPVEEIPTLAVQFLIVPVAMAGQAAIPIPGGLGVGESGLGYLYEWVGTAFVAGFLASLVVRAILCILGFGGYLAYLRMKSGQDMSSIPDDAPTHDGIEVSESAKR